MTDVPVLEMNAAQKRELLARLLKGRTSEEFPLSLGQEGFWFLQELAPDSAAYHVCFSARLGPELDCDRLERALIQLLERHSILRCSFGMLGERPGQSIHPVPAKFLERVDASGWSEQELAEQVEEEYARPFDLAKGPMFRATLFSQSDSRHVLLLTAHHIAYDAWSLGIVLSDLAVLYDKGPASLAPVVGSYADFVKWQRAMIESDAGREAWEYWQAHLKDSLEPVDLPADFLRPGIQRFRGATYHFDLPEALCTQIRARARAESVTPYMVLATAFHALLHRYTGAAQVPIGMPLSGRGRAEFENTVGYFVNPVVIKAPIEPGATFRQHLAGIRESVIGAQRHGDFPLVELIKRLQPVRDTSRSPLFQVMFNMVKSAQIGVAGEVAPSENGTSLRLGSLPLELFPLNQQEGQFDLDLTLVDTGGAMPAILKFSTDLFEASRIERMAGHFVTLLTAAVADPDLQISKLPLLAEAEREQILVEWNATERDYSAANITRAIEEQVRRTPQATAIVFEDQEMSFEEFNRRANQLARHLRSLGVGPDTLVAVCVERSIEMVLAVLGVLKAGGAYVPIDPGYPRERQAYMMQDSGAQVLLTQAALAGTIENAAHLVLLDSRWDEISRHPGEDFENEAAPENLAYVIYTSGSTGKPKGVLIPRRALTNLLWSMREWLKITDKDRLLALATISFDIAGADLWLPLLTGAQMVLGSRETAADGRALSALIEQRDITFLQVTPSTWRLLFEAGWPGKQTLQAVSTGEAMPAEVAARLVPAAGKVWNLYGPTETTIWSTGYEVREATGTILIGRPVANTQCYILDAQGEPVSAGVTGELFIAGDGLARGYHNQPKLTDEKFVPNPFSAGQRMYRTGDLARYRNNGEIECLGRIDHQVKIRGYRIELGEIEAVLAEHPSVAQAVTIAREDVPGDIRLVAYLAARAQATIDVGELQALLRSRLPEYMVPSAFVILEAVPLNPSGKVDRKALPAPDSAARLSRAAAYEPPRTDTEARIAAIWKDVLKVDQVGKNDNFFDLGGHSLLLIKVQGALEKEFARKIAVVELFRFPTIDALARNLTTVEDVSPERDRIQQLANRQKAAVNRMRKPIDRRDPR